MTRNFLAVFDMHRVINLAYRKDRRREVAAEFQQRGLSAPQFYTAIKPTEKPDGWPTLGAYGCFMSHLGVLQAFLASDAKTLLVMEDDIRFRGPVHATFFDLDNHTWDIAYFGALNLETPSSSQRFGYAVVAHDQRIMGTHCIALNRKAARRVAAFMERALTLPDGHPLGGPQYPDGAFSMCRGQNADLKTIIASPLVADQRASATDVHDNRITRLDKLPVIRSALKVLRQLKNNVAW